MVQAVRVGYRVIDGQIEQGREFAKRLRESYVDSGGSVEKVINDGYHLAEKVARLSVEWAENGLRSPGILSAVLDRYVGNNGRSSGNPDKLTSEGLGDAVTALVEALGLTVRPRTSSPMPTEMRVEVKSGKNIVRVDGTVLLTTPVDPTMQVAEAPKENPLRKAECRVIDGVLVLTIDASRIGKSAALRIAGSPPETRSYVGSIVNAATNTPVASVALYVTIP